MNDTVRPLLGAAGSVIIHGALFLYGALQFQGPDLGIEITLPDEVELGLTDGVEQLPDDPGGAAAGEPDPAPAPEVTAAAAGTQADEETRPDAGPPRAAAVTNNTGSDLEGSEPDSLPAGAQVAIRVNLALIRDTAMASEIEKFIRFNPHWRAIFDGSGIDPVAHLRRVLIASPDLRREHVFVVGELEPDAPSVDAMLAQMAQATGVEPSWGRRHRLEVAPWPNLGPTPRLLARLAPRTFCIARPRDLPRIVLVARARAQNRGLTGDARRLGSALLSMTPRQAFSLEWEGYRKFFRGSAIPKRLQGDIQVETEGTFRLRAVGDYDSESQAEEARAFWEGARVRYAAHPLIHLTGFGSSLRETEVQAQATQVQGDLSLNTRQARVGLQMLSPLLAEFERRHAPTKKPPPTKTPPPARTGGGATPTTPRPGRPGPPL